MVGRCNGYNYNYVVEYMPLFAEIIPIDGIELMMLPYYYDKLSEMADLFNRNGLKFPVIHAEKEIGTMISRSEGNDVSEAIELFKLNCEMGAMIGAEKMVLHLWGGAVSDSHVDDNIEVLADLMNIIKPYNIRLLIENIPCTTHSPLENWRKIYKYLPDIGFIFDTRFGAFHNQISEILSEPNIWNSAVVHMHISDYNGKIKEFTKLRPILHPEEGNIDFRAIRAGLDKVDYNGSITLESPVMSENGLDIEKLTKSLKFVRDVLIN